MYRWYLLSNYTMDVTVGFSNFQMIYLFSLTYLSGPNDGNGPEGHSSRLFTPRRTRPKVRTAHRHSTSRSFKVSAFLTILMLSFSAKCLRFSIISVTCSNFKRCLLVHWCSTRITWNSLMVGIYKNIRKRWDI